MTALDQETRLSVNTPAVMTNRFACLATNFGFRIAFGEVAPGETKAFVFHSAIFMSSLADAEALATTILDVVKRHRATRGES